MTFLSSLSSCFINSSNYTDPLLWIGSNCIIWQLKILVNYVYLIKSKHDNQKLHDKWMGIYMKMMCSVIFVPIALL